MEYLPSVLIVVLDVDLQAWQRVEGLSLGDALHALGVFLRSFLLLQRDNRVSVITHSRSSGSSPTFVFSYDVENGSIGLNTQAAALHAALQRTARKLQTEASRGTGIPSLSGAPATRPPSLGSALSLALCYANRVTTTAAIVAPEVRLLIVQSSEDTASDYTQLMNCAFAALNSDILVDVCALAREGSTTLRQIAHITKGVFVRPKICGVYALQQYLLTLFLADKRSRAHLATPTEDPVDLAAMCFCSEHERRRVQVGWVCSVCLSVFCTRKHVCDTCKTRVAFKKRRGNGGRKRPREPSAANSAS